MSFASGGEDIAGISLDLSRISHPENPAVLQDVCLMRETALSQHPEVYCSSCCSLQAIHESRLLAPSQRGLRAVEDCDIEVAVWAKQPVERAAIEEYGPDAGGACLQRIRTGRDQSLDPFGNELVTSLHRLIIDAAAPSARRGSRTCRAHLPWAGCSPSRGRPADRAWHTDRAGLRGG